MCIVNRCQFIDSFHSWCLRNCLFEMFPPQWPGQCRSMGGAPEFLQGQIRFQKSPVFVAMAKPFCWERRRKSTIYHEMVLCRNLATKQLFEKLMSVRDARLLSKCWNFPLLQMLRQGSRGFDMCKVWDFLAGSCFWIGLLIPMFSPLNYLGKMSQFD